jgi:hypothetical protein
MQHSIIVHIAHMPMTAKAVCLQVASTIVDLLQRFFPQHMDRLEREKAFFDGPGPLLLSSLVDDDLAILLSGSDRKESQVIELRSCLARLATCAMPQA